MANLWKSVKKAASKAAPVVSPLAPLTPITTTYKVTKDATNKTSSVVNALPVSSTVKTILDPVATVKKKTPDLSLSSTSAGAAAAAAAKAQAQAQAAAQKELEEKKAAAASRNEGLKLASASASKAASMAAINQAKAEAEKAREKETQEIKNGANVPSDQAAAVANNVDPYTQSVIRDAGAAASEGAAVNIYLPEQEVKSDYTKYLLIGGAVVLAVWLFKKK